MAFSWGPPKSSPISGETGSAVANGNGPAPGLFGASAAPFSFGGFGGASGLLLAHVVAVQSEHFVIA